MRILAAGGDGTVAWILKTIRDLQLDPEPHVAVMPLGTGNDLSLSFGWGNTFLKSWINVGLFWSHHTPRASHRWRFPQSQSHLQHTVCG